MTTKNLVVADGIEKREPTVEEWITLYEKKIPELGRRLREKLLDPSAVNGTIQAMIEGKVIRERGIISPETSTGIITDLDFWLNKSEEFTEKCFGIKVNLREMFEIPERFYLDGSKLPIFVPENVNIRFIVQRILTDMGVRVAEERDIEYCCIEKTTKTALYLIILSPEPNDSTTKMSANQLLEMRDDWLDLYGYILAFGLFRYVTRRCLDIGTSTLLPINRFPNGTVVRAEYMKGIGVPSFLNFSAEDSDEHIIASGARLAISVPLRKKVS